MNLEALAFALIFCSSVSSGAFAVPLKLCRQYAWENIWFVGFIFALIIFPFITLTIFLPQWPQAIRATGISTILLAMAFGCLWGLGTVTLALGITTVGLSLGYTIIHGLTVAAGSVIPMLRRWHTISESVKLVVLLGVFASIVGTVICGIAGVVRKRSNSQRDDGSTPSLSASSAARRVFLIGLFWCILSGFLSSCANLGFEFA